MSRFSFAKNKNKIKRRQHINFKININKKTDLNIFINMLESDIKNRLIIDKKYYNINNECHLKHLNFIMMEILLQKILILFQLNFENLNSNNKMKNIEDDILYTPKELYKKDLTSINRNIIDKKYELMQNLPELEKIAKSIFLKYKDFEFINLNFLKRKIYTFI